MTIAVPTATSMKLKFPEFADLDDAVLEFAIEEARDSVADEDAWTIQANKALLYLSAHYVSAGRAAAAGDTGEIASESIGRLSITYKNSASANSGAVADDLTTSSYGRRYDEIRKLNFGGPVII